MRSQLYSFLLGAYFPTNIRGTTDIERVQYFFLNSSSMLERSGGQNDKFMISERALSAMSCISLGRLNRDYRMARYGVQLHGATMQLISKLMIQDPYNEDFIRAMVILKILEVIPISCLQRLPVAMANISSRATITHMAVTTGPPI